MEDLEKSLLSQSRSKRTFCNALGVPLLVLLCVILATGVTISLATLSGCDVPQDLVNAMKSALHLKLNPKQTITQPYINVTSLGGQVKHTEEMKNLTETSGFTTIRDEFSDDLLKEIDDFERISNNSDMEIIKLQLQDLKEHSLLKKIADLVMAGKVNDVYSIFKKVNNDNTRLEVMKIVYDKSTLKTAILFAKDVGNIDASLVGYKFLFDEMKRNSQMEELEVLLLQYYISKDIMDSNFARLHTSIKDDYLNLKADVDVYIEEIILALVAEVDTKTYSKQNELVKMFGSEVLNMFLPKIIHKYYTPGTMEQATELLNYISELGYISSACVAEEALHKEMTKKDQLTSFEAFNHWLYVRNLIQVATNYKNVAEENKKKCQRVYDEQKENAAGNIRKFMTVYNSENWSEIKIWKQQFPSTLHWILKDVVTEEYKGKVKKINKLEKLFKEINNYGAYCVGYGTLAMQMENYNQFGTFEPLFVYMKIKLAIDDYTSKNIRYDYAPFCERAIEITPVWVKNLDFEDTSRCIIKNKDGSSLLAENEKTNDKNIILKSSGDDETKWKIEVAENGMVSFRNIRYSDLYISLKEGEDDVQSSSSKFQWRVEGSSDGYVRIHAFDATREDFYFVTNQMNNCKNGGLMCVQVKNRKDCGEMCEWKIDC